MKITLDHRYHQTSIEMNHCSFENWDDIDKVVDTLLTIGQGAFGPRKLKASDKRAIKAVLAKVKGA